MRYDENMPIASNLAALDIRAGIDFARNLDAKKLGCLPPDLQTILITVLVEARKVHTYIQHFDEKTRPGKNPSYHKTDVDEF